MKKLSCYIVVFLMSLIFFGALPETSELEKRIEASFGTIERSAEGNEPGEVVCALSNRTHIWSDAGSLSGRGVTEYWFCSCSVLDWDA